MPAAPQDQQQSEHALSPLWIAIGIFIAILIIWQFGHTYISYIAIKIKLMEAQLISLFTNNLKPQLHWLNAAEPANVKAADLSDIAEAVGEYIRYPAVVILCTLAILLFLGNNVGNYRRLYNMQTLLDEEKYNWPQIAPVITLNLVKENIDKGPWAMAMTATQFAKRHNLLIKEQGTASTETLNYKRKWRYTVLKDEAARIFALQLGEYWVSAEKLNLPTKALFAIFAAKANHDRKAAVTLLNQIAASTLDGRLNFSGVQELFDKYKNTKVIKKATSKHAYVYTVMASLLREARQDGVLATAEFLWLKPIDRKLWYMLNNVGRQTAFIEAAGPFSHWLAELAIGHKLMMPMVEPAISGFESAIKEFIFDLDEEEK